VAFDNTTSKLWAIWELPVKNLAPPFALAFWPWQCFIYSASHARPKYQFWLSYD